MTVRWLAPTLIALLVLGSCSPPKDASQEDIEREIARIDAGAPSFRKEKRSTREDASRHEATGYFEGKDLVCVDELITQSNGAYFRSRYYYRQGRVIGTDGAGIMINRPNATTVETVDIRGRYLFGRNGRTLAANVTADGVTMPPSEEMARDAMKKGNVYRDRFSQLAVAPSRSGSTVDSIQVRGRSIVIPTPEGMADVTDSPLGRALVAFRDWKLAFGSKESVLAFEQGHSGESILSWIALVIDDPKLNSTEDAQNVASFVTRRDEGVKREPSWRSPYVDRVRDACSPGGAVDGHVAPTAPDKMTPLWLLRSDANALAWIAIAPSDERSQSDGAAEIVATCLVLVRGREIGLLYGRTRNPSCEEIAAVENGAKEWIDAILTANGE